MAIDGAPEVSQRAATGPELDALATEAANQTPLEGAQAPEAPGTVASSQIPNRRTFLSTLLAPGSILGTIGAVLRGQGDPIPGAQPVPSSEISSTPVDPVSNSPEAVNVVPQPVEVVPKP